MKSKLILLVLLACTLAGCYSHIATPIFSNTPIESKDEPHEAST